MEHNTKEIGFIIFLTLIAKVGLVLNRHVIAFILCNKTLRSDTTNILIVNQALANFLLILFHVTNLITSFLKTWLFGKYCSAHWYLFYACNYASVYTMVLLTADRFLITFYPTSTKSIRTARNTVAAILVLWVLSLACCVPIIFLFQHVRYLEKDYCVFSQEDEHGRYAPFWTIVTTSSFVPLTIMAALLVPIVVRHYREGNYWPLEDGHKGYKSLVVAWVITFFICNIPFNGIQLHMGSPDIFFDLPAGLMAFFRFALTLMYISFCAYPIVFIVMWKCFHCLVNDGDNSSSGPYTERIETVWPTHV